LRYQTFEKENFIGDVYVAVALCGDSSCTWSRISQTGRGSLLKGRKSFSSH
jgi:hypothetical protein